MGAGYRARSSGRRDVWEQFRSDKKLLATYRVTQEELDFLEAVSLFGSLQSVRDIVFILENIRRSRSPKR